MTSRKYVKAAYLPLESHHQAFHPPVLTLSETLKKSVDYECNILIYCTPEELNSLQTGAWTLKHTLAESAVMNWHKTQHRKGHTILTARCTEKEAKNLLHECFQQAGSASSFHIEPRAKGMSYLNAEFIPAKLAVQFGQRLGWPTTGFYYYFVEHKLYQECQLTGDDRWSFYFTRSDATTLTDQLISARHFSNLLLPYRIEGQHVGGQYVLYRKEKLTQKEFSQISEPWLKRHATAIDLNSVMNSRIQTRAIRLSRSHIGMTQKPPASYRVQMNPQTRQRESWPEIAEKHGLSAKQLLALNPDYNDNPLRLQIGDTLLVSSWEHQTQPQKADLPAPVTHFEPGKAYPFGDVWGTYRQRFIMPWLLHIQESSRILSNTPIINAIQVQHPEPT
ncbi:LysM peptidoglycan-binding domain-containing protein (plasmid) [Photobacterium sp. GJ3]|uniref:MIX and LysM peptidoglycan-binding domain-containing protein n=1 Tax=Photobacterium sp. GJ3 TaxID=2829502 RepID=UPI001B8C9842|nr:LysM peptidoglycan-binding domain-containing protein [Photobacterium sp. GJ3]QUJ70496.1 LysM peptidoglycan-binding domain-containing protein [Photobacterium sp. GJ3]